MKILFPAAWFPSRVYPTHGNFIAKHARLLAREHEVTVLAIQYDPALAYGEWELNERLEDGYDLIQIYFGQPEGTASGQKIWSRWKAYRTGIERYVAACGIPDLIHANILLDAGMISAYYARRWKVPYFIAEQCTVYLKTGALPGIRGWLGKYACRHAAAILPVGSDLGKGMRELNGLAGNYRFFSNVVDTSLFDYAPVNAQGPFRFLHVSSFIEEHKNVSGIIRAFTELYAEHGDRVQLQLAGDGDHRTVQQLIDRAALPPEAILLTGPHTEREVAELMRSAHAFVLFSNYETQGVVVLEALATGRPVIATDIPGPRDIMREDFLGEIVTKGDEKVLLAAMQKMMKQYDRYPAKRIREYALARYSEPAILALLNGYYQKALG